MLACSVVPGEFDRWCRDCGAEGTPRDTVTRRLAHEPFGWRNPVEAKFEYAPGLATNEDADLSAGAVFVQNHLLRIEPVRLLSTGAVVHLVDEPAGLSLVSTRPMGLPWA